MDFADGSDFDEMIYHFESVKSASSAVLILRSFTLQSVGSSRIKRKQPPWKDGGCFALVSHGFGLAHDAERLAGLPGSGADRKEDFVI